MTKMVFVRHRGIFREGTSVHLAVRGPRVNSWQSSLDTLQLAADQLSLHTPAAAAAVAQYCH